MTNKKIHIIIACALMLAVTVGAFACSKNLAIKAGSYYESTGKGVDKSSYIEVKSSDTMVFTNIDASAETETLVQLLEQMDGSFSLPNAETGKNEEIVMRDATPEQIASYREILGKRFEGERTYRVAKSGDVNELYFAEDTLAFGEYVPESGTIIIGGISYVLDA